MKKLIKKKIEQADNLAQLRKRDIVLVQEDVGNELKYHFEYREDYDLKWAELCDDKDIDSINKITIFEYRKPVKTFKDACEKADEKAKALGGIWHVIKIKKRYEYVHDHYLLKNKCESLYKSEFDHELNVKNVFPDLNRKQRRKIKSLLFR